jgi:hypothetical protein
MIDREDCCPYVLMRDWPHCNMHSRTEGAESETPKDRRKERRSKRRERERRNERN